MCDNSICYVCNLIIQQHTPKVKQKVGRSQKKFWAFARVCGFLEKSKTIDRIFGAKHAFFDGFLHKKTPGILMLWAFAIDRLFGMENGKGRMENCGEKTAKRFSFEFAGGKFRRLDEIENGGGSRTGGPACPSVFLQVRRRIKKRNDTLVVPYKIFSGRNNRSLFRGGWFAGSDTDINGRFVNRSYNLPHHAIKALREKCKATETPHSTLHTPNCLRLLGNVRRTRYMTQTKRRGLSQKDLVL